MSATLDISAMQSPPPTGIVGIKLSGCLCTCASVQLSTPYLCNTWRYFTEAGQNLSLAGTDKIHNTDKAIGSKAHHQSADTITHI